MKTLLLDIGNSTISMGMGHKTGLSRYASVSSKLSGDKITGFIRKYRPERAIICSVVPETSKKIRSILKRHKTDVFECGEEINIPVINLYKKPDEVGQDRLINVYAVNNIYKDKNIRLVIDSGTALTFDFISPEGEYEGGLIFPGLGLSLKSLLDNCALLPSGLTLKKPRTIYAKSTQEGINNGLVYGYSFLVKGLIEHLKTNRKNFSVLATGGAYNLWIPSICRINYFDKYLALKGLNILSASIK